MKSRYDKLQGIDGIIMVSNDPLVKENVRKAREEVLSRKKSEETGNNKRGRMLSPSSFLYYAFPFMAPYSMFTAC